MRTLMLTVTVVALFTFSNATSAKSVSEFGQDLQKQMDEMTCEQLHGLFFGESKRNLVLTGAVAGFILGKTGGFTEKGGDPVNFVSAMCNIDPAMNIAEPINWFHELHETQ